MLAINELRQIATARLHDAKILYAAERFDGAYYLCGYSVELALTARICRTLKWVGFPDTNKEFERFGSFRVHDLEVLLKLTGYEATIKNRYFSEWSTVTVWNPQTRYLPVSSIDGDDARAMLNAVSILLRKL